MAFRGGAGNSSKTPMQATQTPEMQRMVPWERVRVAPAPRFPKAGNPSCLRLERWSFCRIAPRPLQISCFTEARFQARILHVRRVPATRPSAPANHRRNGPLVRPRAMAVTFGQTSIRLLDGMDRAHRIPRSPKISFVVANPASHPSRSLRRSSKKNLAWHTRTLRPSTFPRPKPTVHTPRMVEHVREVHGLRAQMPEKSAFLPCPSRSLHV